MCNHENNVPTRLSPHWYQQCVTVHHVPKCMSCHKAIVVITGRAYCFHIYYAHLASVRFEHSVCRGSLMTYYIYIYINTYKRLNERALSTGEPCTCEYVILFRSFLQRYIKYTLVHSSKLLAFRRSSKTSLFGRFLKVAIATLTFNSNYNGGFAPEFSVSMLK